MKLLGKRNYSSIPYDVKLDSAMVPEIIYHEFTHVAMSDYIPLTGSFAVSEGIANYFASVISGNTEIAGKLGEYGKNIEPLKIDRCLNIALVLRRIPISRTIHSRTTIYG